MYPNPKKLIKKWQIYIRTNPFLRPQQNPWGQCNKKTFGFPFSESNNFVQKLTVLVRNVTFNEPPSKLFFRHQARSAGKRLKTREVKNIINEVAQFHVFNSDITPFNHYTYPAWAWLTTEAENDSIYFSVFFFLLDALSITQSFKLL